MPSAKVGLTLTSNSSSRSTGSTAQTNCWSAEMMRLVSIGAYRIQRCPVAEDDKGNERQNPRDEGNGPFRGAPDEPVLLVWAGQRSAIRQLVIVPLRWIAGEVL